MKRAPLIKIDLIASIAFFAIQSSLFAHEEPLGEVHPWVISNGNQFEVYFTDDRNKTTNWDGHGYRSIFALDGTPVSIHERFKGKIEGVDDSIATDSLRFEGDVPYLELGPDRDSMKKIFFHPPTTKCEDFCILRWLPGRQIAARFSALSPKQTNHGSFSLGVFDIDSGKNLHSNKIGFPGRIFQSAVTSPVLVHGNELVIAWIEVNTVETTKYGQEQGCRVVLTRWNPASGKLLHLVIRRTFSSNAAISIGAIGNTAMVAWSNYGPIKTEVVSLDSKGFAKTMPELKQDMGLNRKFSEEVRQAIEKQKKDNL